MDRSNAVGTAGYSDDCKKRHIFSYSFDELDCESPIKPLHKMRKLCSSSSNKFKADDITPGTNLVSNTNQKRPSGFKDVWDSVTVEPIASRQNHTDTKKCDADRGGKTHVEHSFDAVSMSVHSVDTNYESTTRNWLVSMKTEDCKQKPEEKDSECDRSPSPVYRTQKYTFIQVQENGVVLGTEFSENTQKQTKSECDIGPCNINGSEKQASLQENDNVDKNIGDKQNQCDADSGPCHTDGTEKPASQQVQGDDYHHVLYVYSQELIDHCNKLPRILDRAGMVHSLIEAFGLLKYLHIVPPKAAKEEDILSFHARDYIEFLQRINHLEDEEKADSDDMEQYGLTYDCPVQEGVYDCAAMVAGATVTGAEALCTGQCGIAINWCGGWHHAQRSEASGFCYINDIVLGILTLRSKFSRVLYVDLDLHHGDGVENAFSTTPHVFTVSFHKYDSGFFPGSGNINDVGFRGGKYYCINVPLKDGIRDSDFFSVFKRVMMQVHQTYKPEVVVCQCGADGLAGDPMASFNLTLDAFTHCLHFLMQWKLPLLLLGGGGYHHANTSRCWASLTALAVSRRLPQDVPDHKYFTDYGPYYELALEAGNRKNLNSPQNLLSTCKTVTENLNHINGELPQ